MEKKETCSNCLNCRSNSLNDEVLPKIEKAVDSLFSVMAELKDPILQAEVLGRISAAMSMVEPKINTYAKGIAEQLTSSTAAYFYEDKDFFDEINNRGINYPQATAVKQIETLLSLNPQWVERFNEVKERNVREGKSRIELMGILGDNARKAEHPAALKELVKLDGVDPDMVSLSDLADALIN
jgi:hypothetical protein